MALSQEHAMTSSMQYRNIYLPSLSTKDNRLDTNEKCQTMRKVDDSYESEKENNTKKKLIKALNNIHHEINIKIDSKDTFKNNKINLEHFINRPIQPIKNKILEQTLTILEDNEHYNNYQESKNVSLSSGEGRKNDLKPIKNNFTKTDNYNNNITTLNEDNNNFILQTEPIPAYNHKKSLNVRGGDKTLSEERISKNTSEINLEQFVKPQTHGDNDTLYNENNQDKLTLYNLDENDKIFLKKLEKDNAFVINDISALNDKKGFNISLEKFDCKQILKLYLDLMKEYKQEQKVFINLKNVNLENKSLNSSKRNIKQKKCNLFVNKDKSISSKISNNTDTKSKDNILYRYINDLNYFKDIINNMNDEIQNV